MSFILAIDYDGTLFSGSWPEIGAPRKEVIKQVKAFRKSGAEIILWTCREGKSLQEALSRCTEQGLDFDAVNEGTHSEKAYQQEHLKSNGAVFGLRKVYANLYVDDRSPGSIEYFLKLDAKKVSKEKHNEFKKST